MATTVRPDLDWLMERYACDEGREYTAARRGPADAWRRCRRLEWIKWLMERAPVDDRLAMAAACRMARAAESTWPAARPDAPRRVLAVAEMIAAGRSPRARLEAVGESLVVYRETAIGDGDDRGFVAWDCADSLFRAARYALGLTEPARSRSAAYWATDVGVRAATCLAERAVRLDPERRFFAACADFEARMAAIFVRAVPYAAVAAAAGLPVHGRRKGA